MNSRQTLRRDSFLDSRYLARGLAWDYGDGEELPRHTHGWAQLVYAETGVMQVQTPDVAWLVPTTRAIWIPPDVTHWIRMRGAVAMRSLYFAAVPGRWPDRCAAIEVSPLLRELILYAVRATWLAPGNAHHQRLFELLADLIGTADAVPLALPMPRDPRGIAMANRLLREIAAGGSLTDLADGTGASLRTQQRIFRAETGMPLDQWRLRARMQQAVVALASGSSITDAALSCGYRTPGSFASAFKRLFGQPPSRYRQPP